MFQRDKITRTSPRDNLKHSISPIDQKVAPGSHLKNMVWFFTKKNKIKNKYDLLSWNPQLIPPITLKECTCHLCIHMETKVKPKSFCLMCRWVANNYRKEIRKASVGKRLEMWTQERDCTLPLSSQLGPSFFRLNFDSNSCSLINLSTFYSLERSWNKSNSIPSVKIITL